MNFILYEVWFCVHFKTMQHVTTVNYFKVNCKVVGSYWWILQADKQD